MSVLRIEVGEAAKTPAVNAWLNPTRGGFELVLKHSDDPNDQRLFFFDLHDGKLQIQAQGLCSANLCAAFGIEKGAVPEIKPWGSALQATHAETSSVERGTE